MIWTWLCGLAMSRTDPEVPEARKPGGPGGSGGSGGPGGGCSEMRSGLSGTFPVGPVVIAVD